MSTILKMFQMVQKLYDYTVFNSWERQFVSVVLGQELDRAR